MNLGSVKPRHETLSIANLTNARCLSDRIVWRIGKINLFVLHEMQKEVVQIDDVSEVG